MSWNKAIKNRLNPVRSWLLHDPASRQSEASQLLGRLASWQVRARQTISCLQDVEFSVSSQWGEDGILDWLIERAEIPPAAHSFIEFGVEDYREANTRFLLRNRNWRGLIMDGSARMLDAVKEDGLYWRYDLLAKPAFITRENINDLFSQSGWTGEIGLLSIDLDGNDYWIWESINVVQPILLICEYNAVLGDIHPLSVPYAPDFNRTSVHCSNLYFGASIAALRSLAARKGYVFVGTTSAGNDAFFVREDYAQHFTQASLKIVRALPSKARESRDESGKLTYVSKLDRLKIIDDLPLINTETGQTTRLRELSSVYSDPWLALMTGPSAGTP